MQIVDINQVPQAEVVAMAVATLRSGGLVIYPTETVYGAGVDATNQTAVDKLLKYKSRREGKPLSIAVTDQSMATNYVKLNDQAKKLYQTFLPGPVTVVSTSLGRVAPGVESEFGTLGIRIPDYPLVVNMVKILGSPITATSANSSGKKRPYSVANLLATLSDKQKSLIDLILDAGTLPTREPSTVIDTTLSTPVLIRAGAVDLGHMTDQLTTNSPDETQAYAGRLMLKHWSKLGQTGLVIGLIGPLGAGKTVFTQGVATFLGITEPITSPTYTYLHEYDWHRGQSQGKLYHADLWKLDTTAELDRLKFDDCLGQNQVLCVEWADHQLDELKRLCQTHNTPLLLIEIQDLIGQRQLKVGQIP